MKTRTVIMILSMGLLFNYSIKLYSQTNFWGTPKHPGFISDGKGGKTIDVSKIVAKPEKEYSESDYESDYYNLLDWLQSIRDARNPPSEEELAFREYKKTGDKEAYDREWLRIREKQTQEMIEESERRTQEYLDKGGIPLGLRWSEDDDSGPITDINMTYDKNAANRDLSDNTYKNSSKATSSNDFSDNSNGAYHKTKDGVEYGTYDDTKFDKNKVIFQQGKPNAKAVNRSNVTNNAVLTIYKNFDYSEIYKILFKDIKQYGLLSVYDTSIEPIREVMSDPNSLIVMNTRGLVFLSSEFNLEFEATLADGDYYTYIEKTNTLMYSVTANCYKLDDKGNRLELVSEEALINIALLDNVIGYSATVNGVVFNYSLKQSETKSRNTRRGK